MDGRRAVPQPDPGPAALKLCSRALQTSTFRLVDSLELQAASSSSISGTMKQNEPLSSSFAVSPSISFFFAFSRSFYFSLSVYIFLYFFLFLFLFLSDASFGWFAFKDWDFGGSRVSPHVGICTLM